MTEEQEDILALFGVPGVGAKTHARLIMQFGSPAGVFDASLDELMMLDGIGNVVAGNIKSFDRRTFVMEQKQLMEKAGAQLLTRASDDYPAQLNCFVSAPPILFVRGNPEVLHLSSIAIVGTRKPTSYGKAMAEKLAGGAAESGLSVVSGMAEGIDSSAHKGALESGGVTVAVFGCGVDIIFPTFNQELSEKITKSGCLVSHFPMGTMGKPGNFPARNSVIVGLSRATIVVEAPKISGAIITAELTIRAGRRLFSVPGNADSINSEGANSLFALGAFPVKDFNSVLKEMGRPETSHTSHTGKAPGKAISFRPFPKGLKGDILREITEGPMHIEALCDNLGEPVAAILTELTSLELDGFVRQAPGMMFEKAL